MVQLSMNIKCPACGTQCRWRIDGDRERVDHPGMPTIILPALNTWAERANWVGEQCLRTFMHAAATGLKAAPPKEPAYLGWFK